MLTYDAAGLYGVLVDGAAVVGEVRQLSPHLLHVEQVGVDVHVLQAVRVTLLQLTERLHRQVNVCKHTS